MSDREDDATGTQDLAEEMGRATQRLRDKAWMLNALKPALPTPAETEATEDATT